MTSHRATRIIGTAETAITTDTPATRDAARDPELGRTAHSRADRLDIDDGKRWRKKMRRFLIGVASALALSGAGLGVTPVASAGPYCDFFDLAGLCDVRDALKACEAYPEACEEYSPPPNSRYESP
jgi:hypothetical protein